MNLKKLILIALSTITVSAFVGCGEQNEEEVDHQGNQRTGETVAIVNGQEIDKEEFEETKDYFAQIYEAQGIDLDEDEEMNEQVTRQVIDELVSEELLIQEAKDLEISPNEELVEEELEEYKNEFEDDDQLEEQLGLSVEQLEQQISDSLMIDKLIDEQVQDDDLNISEDELKQMYDQQIEQQQEMMPEDEEIDEAELPEFEEIKSDLEEMALEEKKQEQVGKLIHELKDESDIEILY
ncbi:SurA N-terminal domain-containing protein [Natranaerobius trueperi]|uniref:peptidylprolyl isomerase n=1 Tax=Natranaerobius trueperi TaxID=759412 RepID=A0A226BVW7_9FIRM|nr:SurA N-terminal domain-containing protein [Natranaerobius trueperi]OWZ82922.1 hypothetical protein CDO51_11310 [Natranaerobius trueperi]